ncbi:MULTISPECIES: Rieske (2Fe-2S) protein [Streptomyces]|uniref:Cytochrome bc1 complex Rieske iron-sulfur subunit n=1 Tax=Streptomyces murinus TaxID=33900 RepID=A0A7W3NLZ0_STRMR|nr:MULTISPECIES: Rieske (2Fe-2S) protein [Streptomyces]MYR00343.1 Rieske 2Fe-2S domain-containing protein [Streptomyces sp. SID6139]NDK24361.1 Rieske (2Fe-2S) protein [Streptomyces sp. TR1341]MBA9052955.1 Rieske Fe-S protein [Streptomyces murinus]MCE3035573.1 Rieske (2Fe-2S) protein [Streptomyces sp. CMSTAAHL-2]UWW94139.1 Rieske 2Fe-2S domain-containing protein [Streptomyces murinus]
MPTRPSASRRTVLRGAAVVPVAGLGLAACSGPGGSGSAATPTAPVDLGAESDVAKGGAKLYKDHNVVVSRDKSGTLKAYSTVCTHAGCPINKLQGTTLICPCHGSEFDAVTGKVVQSPATEPLTELSVKTQNGRIVAGPAA